MLDGKRRGQPLAATSAPGQQTARFLYVTDRESRLRFLVHTGSEESIIPPSKAQRKNQQHTLGMQGRRKQLCIGWAVGKGGGAGGGGSGRLPLPPPHPLDLNAWKWWFSAIQYNNLQKLLLK